MPYKIYTYADPYQLDKADFWQEIASLPHFCGAQTQANGLRDVLGDQIKGLLCPLDKLVRHADVYQKWTDDIGLRLQQHSALSGRFKRLLDAGGMTNEFYMSLVQNQHYFLDAIRLFIELDIPAAAIDGRQGNQEQRLFVNTLGAAQRSELFRFRDDFSREKLKNAMVQLAGKEIDEARKHKRSLREIRRCEGALEITRQQPLKAVVVHGVHQFTPVQLRLLMAMEKMDITIIFLFNYQKKYAQMYSSWSDIYSCFDAVPHHDTVVPEYGYTTMQNPSNALACAMGELCEDRQVIGSPQMKRWYQLFRDIELREFANITEYAHFVSNHVEKARNKYRESLGVLDRGNEVWDNAAVLRCMEEQVYTANRDIHTLLNIYYPEYSPERHFLAYPIGQFFSALYRLWDCEKGCIAFDVNAIKECLSSNILNTASGDVLLKTFYNLDVLFDHITTYEQFEKEIAGDYVRNYDSVAAAKRTDGVFPLKQLVVYNKYKVSRKDVDMLVRAIREINEIAAGLFAQESSQDDFIHFGDHFNKLERFLKQREMTLANEKERELIAALQLRLGQIRPESSRFSGTFRDLREGIHFYLKQKENAERSPDWIVKNFEQIDGDILQSQRQFRFDEKKTYHFACLSDRDMNQTVNDQLPWPLTDEFLSKAYLPQDMQFQIYCKTLDRRSEFLRYSLFYGLFYNRCDVRLSFVRQYGEETTEPYALLSILGLKPVPGLIEKTDHRQPFGVNIPQKKIANVKYDGFEMMDMFLCPHRYFLDYVMGEAPVVHGQFLFQKYFENLLIEAVWKRIEGKPRDDAEQYLNSYIDQECARLAPYFRFWNDTDILDLKRRARNYLAHEKIKKGNSRLVEAFNAAHMQMRRQFGAAKFNVDITDGERKNPYEQFDALAVRKYPMKEYSLHSLPETNPPQHKLKLAEALREDTKNYINQTADKDKSAIPSDWCNYCPHRGLCMESYLAGELIDSGLTTGGVSRRRARAAATAAIRTDRPIVDSVLSESSNVVVREDQHPPVQITEERPVVIQATPNSEKEAVESAVKTTAVEMPVTAEGLPGEKHAQEAEAAKSRQEDMSAFEAMLRSIQDMVAENSQEIMGLKRELTTRRTRREDTSRVEALLADQERKSQELLAKLGETESRLATAEAQNRSLSFKVKTQGELLEQRKALEFTEAEVEELNRYTAIIIFDTCSIMNYPNLLNGVQDGELVVVPKDVNNELEHHKTAHYYDDRKMKAQRAITAIFNYKRRYPLIYADAMLELVPAVYRADEGERELNDNKILAVAIRYRRYTNVPVVFITDDRSLSNKAAGEEIEVWTAGNFLTPPAPVAVPQQSGNEEVTVRDEGASEQEKPNESSADEQRREEARTEFLAQKISMKTLKLDARQVSILQNNGVKTIADFLKQTESAFSGFKTKKGMLFVAQYLREQERLRQKLEQL